MNTFFGHLLFVEFVIVLNLEREDFLKHKNIWGRGLDENLGKFEKIKFEVSFLKRKSGM